MLGYFDMGTVGMKPEEGLFRKVAAGVRFSQDFPREHRL